jgi:hypothetical protein
MGCKERVVTSPLGNLYSQSDQAGQVPPISGAIAAPAMSVHGAADYVKACTVARATARMESADEINGEPTRVGGERYRD